MKPTSMVPFVAFAVLITGCAARELDSQREQWEAVRPAHYSFKYEETGFVPHVVKAIEIRGDKVVSVECTGSDAPSFSCDGFTIDELFDRLERAIDDADSVTYNPDWHFPASAGWSEGEEGWGFVVTEFAKRE